MTQGHITKMLVAEHGEDPHQPVSLVAPEKDSKASGLKMKKDSAEAILSSVTEEMDKPRVAMSARPGFEAAIKNNQRA